jgi:hypothetical protein
MQSAVPFNEQVRIPKVENQLIECQEPECPTCSRKRQDAARASHSKPRHFVTCIGCSRRFLAKRADATACSPRCRQRAARRTRVSQIIENVLPEAA